MRALLATAVLALTAASGSAAPRVKKVDLSGQFPGAAVRDQGDTNTCHVFSTIALLEAALHRRWGASVALSEADLFVRKVIQDPEYYSRVEAAVGGARGAEPAYLFVESGGVDDDLAFALANGVATAKTAPWPAFAKRYEAFLDGQREELRAHDQDVVIYSGAQAQLSAESDGLGALEREGRIDQLAGVARARLERLRLEVAVNGARARRTFGAFLRQLEGKTRQDGEDILLGVDPERAREHDFLKALTAGFRVYQPELSSSASGAACRAERKEALLAALDRGIPVGLSMDVGGLDAWGVSAAHASHAFSVTGYEIGSEGKMRLRSRNSWGGINPEVSEDQFCRISRIVEVLTDREQTP